MDEKTLAYINLYAILGAVTKLCEIDEEAKRLIKGKDVSIGFEVKGGPAGTLTFKDDKCTFTEGTEGCMVRLPFSSPKRFNGLIDGTVTPIPSKGFTKLGFLLKTFTKLTDKLNDYLRPEPGKLTDPDFFNKSTELMFYLILEAIAQVGNLDEVGRASASYIVDGNVRLAVGGTDMVGYVEAKKHMLTTYHEAPERVMSYMEFSDIETARDLFDGNINAVVAVGLGNVRIGGMISQVDNVNRILDRVALYLA